MKYEILHHACVRVEDDIVIYFDPYGLGVQYHDADLVLITHSHYDHYCPEDIAKVAKSDTIYVTPQDEEIQIQGDVHTMKPFDQIQVKGCKIEAIPAFNINKEFHKEEFGWLGYIITVNGKRIYVAGDTDATKYAELVDCDIAFLPVGGTYTCDYIEAATLAKTMKAKEVIPYHFGAITGTPEDGKRFYEALKSWKNEI